MTQHRWLQLAGMALLVTAVTLILLIINGRTNPQPVGPTIWQGEPLRLVANAAADTLLPPTLPPNAAIHLTSQHSGEPDSAIGLLLTDGVTTLRVLTSPLGYAAIQQTTCPTCPPTYLIPWQPWPHAHKPNSPNELWLHQENNILTVWLNREIFWQETLHFTSTRFGITSETSGATAVYHIQSITLHQP
jgi:hypothetical protein